MNNTYISLTTFSGRLELVRYTIESLLRQKICADKIYLNISKDPYLIAEGISEYPNWLKELVKNKKIEVSVVDNMGPYRKLIPIILKLKKEDNIVICDDDVIYGEDWLKVLLSNSAKHPDDIICMHSRKIRRILNDTIESSYIYWPVFYGRDYQANILPIGVGGVFYKVRFFDLNFLLNKEFLNIAPVNDDLWFWYSCNNKGRMVSSVKPSVNCYFYPIETLSNLTEINYSTSSKFKSYLLNKLIQITGFFGRPVVKNDISWIAIKKFKNNINFHRKN